MRFLNKSRNTRYTLQYPIERPSSSVLSLFSSLFQTIDSSVHTIVTMATIASRFTIETPDAFEVKSSSFQTVEPIYLSPSSQSCNTHPAVLPYFSFHTHKTTSNSIPISLDPVLSLHISIENSLCGAGSSLQCLRQLWKRFASGCSSALSACQQYRPRQLSKRCASNYPTVLSASLLYSIQSSIATMEPSRSLSKTPQTRSFDSVSTYSLLFRRSPLSRRCTGLALVSKTRATSPDCKSESKLEFHELTSHRSADLAPTSKILYWRNPRDPYQGDKENEPTYDKLAKEL